MKNFIKYLIPSFLGSAITIALFLVFGYHKSSVSDLNIGNQNTPVKNVVYGVNEDGKMVPLDFRAVSNEAMNSVVHVTSKRTMEVNNPYSYRFDDPMDNFFRFFYGEPRQQQKQKNLPQKFEQEGTGSGVIISPKGYIVTNNHVINGADEIEVTLHNNDVYKAKVIGTDPSTDLALLQIKADKLPSIPIGNSKNVEVGEWVLAIGNPFNLDATVTAGIVSAKGRNINIIDDKSAIEAFIQTDAAINPGNSGGALVNLKGELIGINTAIASPTGSYAGYGFAIPSSIVQKVLEDMIKYGSVRRAYLGIMIRNIDGDFAKEHKLGTAKGAYVDSITENSAAAKAGIMNGDVIVGIDGTSIEKSADVLEQVGIHHPGDEINVKIDRKGKMLDFNVQLTGKDGSTKILSESETDIFQQLGATFKTLDKNDAEALGLKGGVIISELHPGIIENETQLEEGFIITRVNHERVNNVGDLEKALKKANGGVLVEGIYEDYPGTIYVAFGLPE